MMETTEKDLVNAVRDSLKNDGHLGRVKAELRSAIMSVLNKNCKEDNVPQLPDETKLINDLIREYLAWNGYVYSEQVLAAESSQHSERLPRDNLAAKLNVADDERTAKIPLLYYVVAAFQNQESDGS
ncbi:centrosomal protein 20-like [Onthophagus taurus]|uniref:centrosomal protein 20-like n=1 Tax=Onthophagus taurus TaxID=166361 RepID=UPI000C2037C2|nr:lisH domain-containing protein FOPNL-like [Onthophagus taurus]